MDCHRSSRATSTMSRTTSLQLIFLPLAASLKAAIIGGGLGGLTCCNALRKIGIDAHVYERAQTLSPQAGTGLTLWPNGLSALQAIDAELIPHIKEVGGATTTIEVTSPDGLTKLPNPTGDPTRFTSVYGQPMFNVRWSKLQRVLAARLPENCIHLDCGLTHVAPKAGGGVTATFEHAADAADATAEPLVADFDFVVGADGINSALRRQLVDDGAPRDAGRTIWRSIIEYDAALLPEGGCSMSAGAGLVGFLTQLGEGELYWCAHAHARTHAYARGGGSCARSEGAQPHPFLLVCGAGRRSRRTRRSRRASSAQSTPTSRSTCSRSSARSSS